MIDIQAVKKAKRYYAKHDLIPLIKKAFLRRRHDHIKACSSLPDLIGRHLLVEYCDRVELAHVPLSPSDKDGQI